ncbi:hypothetical protein ACGYLO_12540 [Sulfitobacter sp. 1A13353]|uniref:hypothetical protein n=1 Tax=Sulfitobacter sp. 1A13353 TaxID=3368568 RepID=UPI0037459392
MQAELKMLEDEKAFQARGKASKRIWGNSLIYPIAAVADEASDESLDAKVVHALSFKKSELSRYGDFDAERGDFKMDEVIMRAKSVEMIIDYPLNKPAHLIITDLPEDCLTAHLICKSVSEACHEIYRIEDQGQEVPKTQEAGGITFLNRPSTDGAFGVWGHGITDLVIEIIEVYDEGDGRALVRLAVGS